VRLRQPLAREALLSAAAAATVAALLAWIGPPGTDLAAHVYQRTLFLQHGFTLWNNWWYAGRYSFVTYSVLYYPLAALLGIRLLAVATIALAALAFAVVLGREWGPSVRWSSRTFAVVWAGIVLSAAFPFALGIALALLALWALQGGARWRVAGLAALTLAASPLAFLLLGVVLAGVALARRESLLRNWALVVALGCAALVEVALWRIFPADGGRFPFSWPEFAAGVVFCVVCLGLTWRVEAARVLRFVFAAYLVTLVTLFVVPSEIGENGARLRYAAIPLVTLVFALRGWRPRVFCVIALTLAVSWNVTPLAYSLARNGADVTANASTWPAAIAFLRAHLTPSYRVEAVDTATHFSAAYLAAASIPIARGWYRQDDFPQNEVLYDHLGAHAYLHWLRSLGVRYVVLPKAPPDYSSRAEAALVRNGRAGLKPVFRTSELTIYTVPRPRPIITGPRRPFVTAFGESRIGLVVHGGGIYRIAVRWSPYWHATLGCLREGRDGMLTLTTRKPHYVRLDFRLDVGRALAAIAGERPDCKLP
jgi:hypothetical protein